MTELASLEVVSYAKLADRDEVELARLLKACETQGFFYLDVAGSNSKAVENRLEAVSLTKKWFAKPIKEKMLFNQDSVIKGYKPIGTLAGVVEQSRDGYENFKMPRDDFINGVAVCPPGLEDHLAQFRSDLESSNDVALTILQCLSDVLEPNVRFEDNHRGDMPSRSSTMYFRYAKQSFKDTASVGHNMHTDLGTLTILYSEEWGLQVYNQDANTWAFVAPAPGKFIVNVGDSLRFLSSRRLRSALHRVVPVASSQDNYRYSSAYFLRPENEAQFRTNDDLLSTALNWHDSKYKIFKQDHSVQAKTNILTGGITVQTVETRA